MMVDKEDLGLSLTLGFGNPKAHHGTGGTNSFSPSLDPHLLQLNLMSSHSPPLPNLPFSSSSSSVAPLRNLWNHPFASSSSDRASEAPYRVMATGDQRSFPKGIDVNRLPASAAEDDVSSPNSTLSSVSGKRGEHVGAGEDHEADRACSRGISDEEDGETSRKKLRLSKEQSAVLEETFKEHSTLNPKQKLALANRLGLRSRQVEVWFQNRRARTKLKQTEVDCEFLKRCCDQLTEENRRLQKEVQELRSLKLSPQFYMQMTPPTTLTMCPSCERVGTKASSVI